MRRAVSRRNLSRNVDSPNDYFDLGLCRLSLSGLVWGLPLGILAGLLFQGAVSLAQHCRRSERCGSDSRIALRRTRAVVNEAVQ